VYDIYTNWCKIGVSTTNRVSKTLKNRSFMPFIMRSITRFSGTQTEIFDFVLGEVLIYQAASLLGLNFILKFNLFIIYISCFYPYIKQYIDVWLFDYFNIFL